MPGLFFDASVNMSQLERDFQRGNQSVQDFVRQNEQAASQIDSLYRNAATAVAAYFTFESAKEIGSQVIEVRGQMQQLSVAFTTMLGSKEKADELMMQMVNTAATTPFSLTQVSDGAKRLLAYGVGAKEVNDTLIKLGNAASGVSVPLDRMILAYGQVKAKGKLQGDDMRQFMEMGLPLVHELATQFGVTDDKISKMVETGKVGFGDVQQAINNMTGAGGQFYNLMQEQSKTLPGMISNLGDSIDQMFNKMGAENQSTIEGTIGMLKWMVDNYQEFINILKIAVATYGTYKAAVIALNVAEKIRYQVTLAQMASTQGLTTLQALQAVVIGRVKDAQAMLNKTILANPYALAAAAIIALVSTLVLFTNTTTAAEKAAEKLRDITKDASDSATDERSKIDGLVATIKSEVSTREQKNNALKKLNDIMPDNLGYITEEMVRTGKATSAIEAYILAVDKQIKIDAIRDEMKQSQQRIRSAGKDVGVFTELWNTIKGGGNAALGNMQDIVDVVTNESQYYETLKKELKRLTDESNANEDKIAQSKGRTIDVIDEEIKQKEEERKSVAKTRLEYEAYTKQIEKLEAEKKSITGGSANEKDKKDGTAYREQMAKIYQEINDDKTKLVKEGIDQELQLIRNGYTEKINEINKKEEDLIIAYNKSKGIEKGSKNFIKELPVDAQDAILKLRGLADAVKATSEVKLLLGGDSVDFSLPNNLDDLLNKTRTYEQQRMDIIVNADLEINQLRTKGFETNAKEREKQKKKDLEELDSSHRTEVKSWEYLYAKIDSWGKEQLSSRIVRLKADLENTKYTAEEKLAISKALADTEAELSKKAPLSAIKVINDRIAKAKRDISNAKSDVEKIKAQNELDTAIGDKAKLMSESFSNVAGHLQNIAGIARQFNDDLGDAIELAGQLVGVFSQLASGNYIGAAISAASSVVSYVMNSNAKKEAEKEADRRANNEAVKEQIEAINRLYDAQNKLLEKALGLDKLKESSTLWNQAKKNIEEVADRLEKLNNIKTKNGREVVNADQAYFSLYKLGDHKYNTSRGDNPVLDTLDKVLEANREKIKHFNEQLANSERARLGTKNQKEILELIAEYEKYAEQLEAIAQKQREILTGSTYDSVVDSLASAFDDGIVSAEEFTSKFGDLMKKQVLNALKMQSLEKPLQEFYKQFALASESDGKLTAEEVANLKTMYDKIAVDAKTKFDDLNKIMKDAGLDLFGATSTKENSAVGIVKNLSENTGTEIVGNLTGMRYDIREQHMTIREQLAVMNESVSIQRAIEANTASAARSLTLVVGQLNTIANQMGTNSSTSSRATGL